MFSFFQAFTSISVRLRYDLECDEDVEFQYSSTVVTDPVPEELRFFVDQHWRILNTHCVWRDNICY